MKRLYLFFVIICLGLVACAHDNPNKPETANALTRQVEQVQAECENDTLNSTAYTKCQEKLVGVKRYTVELILEGKVSNDYYGIVIESVDSAIVELEIIKKNMQRKSKDKVLKDNALLGEEKSS